MKIRVFIILTIFSLSTIAGIKIPEPTKNFEGLGDTLQFVPTIAGYMVTYFKEDLEGTKQLTRSTLATVGLTAGIKEATKDTSWGERPNGHARSFPSGHTSFACTGASF